LTANLHYGRAGRAASSRRLCVVACSLTVVLLAASHATAQYPGQVDKKDKDKEAPSLRAVAVLEWTGDLTKPKTSRLVPITVYDGEQLQDGSVYMARPQPMAVADGVEYILQKNGAKLGLYDVEKSGQEQGSWVGFGAWKPMPKPKPAPAAMQKIDEDDANSDRPVLHRKHNSGGDSSKDGSGPQGPPPDPDRPTLHKAPDASQTPSQSSGSDTSNAPTDPDRPTLHKAPDASQTSGSPSTQSSGQTSTQTSGQSSGANSSSTSTSSDPDRPQLKRGKAKQQADEGYVSSVENTDPDRPRLLRGKPADSGPAVTPTLMGLPSDMEQAVAVSDPRNRPEHPWNYTWANLDDEAKMKAAMEDAARTALGIQTPPPAPAPRKTAATRAKAKQTPPPEPAPLVDEQFRVFELAYGAGATLVLTAHTDGPPNQQKYVTLIGQPDLYGSLLVLFKNVGDGAHLDDSPRMRLVDAVDALADNRGELLFELRGKTQRQFALYRVVRGTATQLFVTGGGATAIEAQN
jgi:hypothetical protein